MSENGMDQSLRLTSGDMMIFNEVDKVVEASLIAGDVQRPLMFGRALIRNTLANGAALAKLLTRIQDNWELYVAGGADDNFVDTVTATLGLSAQTVLKYTDMWRALFDAQNISDEYKEQLLGKPIKSLIRLTAGIKDGSIDLGEAVKTVSYSEVCQLVRESKGQQTSSRSGVMIAIDVRDGNLMARSGDGIWEKFGWLNLELQEKSDVVSKAIDRILRNAEVIQK